MERTFHRMGTSIPLGALLLSPDRVTAAAKSLKTLTVSAPPPRAYVLQSPKGGKGRFRLWGPVFKTVFCISHSLGAKRMKRVLSAALAALASMVVAVPAAAATFTINPANSQIQLDANFNGSLFGLQAPGSNVTSYVGTIEASVGAGPTPVITLDAGSVAVGLTNPNAPGGEFLPLEGGGPVDPENDMDGLGGGDFIFADGSIDPLGVGDGVFSVGTDNYGLNSGSIFVAGRNIALTTGGSGTANDAIADLGVNLTLIDGWTAIDLGGLGPFLGLEDRIELALAGAGGANMAGDLTFTQVGSVQTITIPTNFTFLGPGFDLFISGQIEASRVPEPTSALLLASFATCAGAVARRRRK